MKIESLFDPQTFTFSYIVWDEQSRDAIVIDPILDLDMTWMKLSTHSISKIVEIINNLKLKVHFVIDTHPHADHISGANHLAKIVDAKSAIGKNFSQVQKEFAEIFGTTVELLKGSYDHHIDDGEKLVAGTLLIEAISTPGHTPACISLHVGDSVFVGDVLFQPALGTGRCDFPSGSAKDLYHSVFHKIYRLPDNTIVYTGHDYPLSDQLPKASFSLSESKNSNKLIRQETSEEEFIEIRSARDQQLSPPKLLYFSLWANIHSGYPPPSPNGLVHFPIPVNAT